LGLVFKLQQRDPTSVYENYADMVCGYYKNNILKAYTQMLSKTFPLTN